VFLEGNREREKTGENEKVFITFRSANRGVAASACSGKRGEEKKPIARVVTKARVGDRIIASVSRRGGGTGRGGEGGTVDRAWARRG